MGKDNKSDFVGQLEKNVGDTWETKHSLPPSDKSNVFLVYAMAFIQWFQHMDSNTFGELSKKYLNKPIQMKTAGCKCIHIVGVYMTLTLDSAWNVMKDSEETKPQRVQNMFSVQDSKYQAGNPL